MDVTAGYRKTEFEVKQILGKVLGYPLYKDDQANFPGYTEADGICVGEHTSETLAIEAAREITKLREVVVENEKLRKENADAAALRFAFHKASEEFGNMFVPASGKRASSWGPNKDEVRLMEIWNRMFEAVRDTCAGLTILSELARKNEKGKAGT